MKPIFSTAKTLFVKSTYRHPTADKNFFSPIFVDCKTFFERYVVNQFDGIATGIEAETRSARKCVLTDLQRPDSYRESRPLP